MDETKVVMMNLRGYFQIRNGLMIESDGESKFLV